MSNIQKELEELKKKNKKLALESKLRKSMSAELDRQKELLKKAQIDIAEQKDKIEEISIKLSRYLPSQIYEQIFSGNLDIHKKNQRKKLTIFFSDIVEFTSLSEQIEAEELSAFLTECNLRYLLINFVLLDALFQKKDKYVELIKMSRKFLQNYFLCLNMI